MTKIIVSVEGISIDKIIQISRYKNIDIFASTESVRKSISLIKDLYNEKEAINLLIKTHIRNSDTFIRTEND